MKTFVYSAHEYEIPFLKKAAEGKHELFFTELKLSAETAALAKGCDAVALFTADDASASVVDILNQVGVKYIALRSAGYDHVNLPTAKKNGLMVANVPSYSPYSIAEHAVALLFAWNRRIIAGQALMNTQDYRLNTLKGFDVHGKTVGIIGTGTIGAAFTKIMNGFGTLLLGYDPVQNVDLIKLGMQYVSFEELLKQSDIISIHCPLNEKTRYLISAAQFQIMKKNCLIINTARGGVINTMDLLHAIETGQISGACLDVYEYEKKIFFEDHRSQIIDDELYARLRSKKNVLITGHQAFLTDEALSGIAETTIHNLNCWQAGEVSPNTITFYPLYQ